MSTKPLFPTRRTAMIGLAGAAGAALIARPGLAQDARKVKPGDFTWQPQLQPRGPVSIIVSVKDQLLHVHRRGVKIGISTVSTGKPGHDTPTGVFTVLEKDKDHVSNIYDSEMPFMQRLTWSGIALHAGALPGYPASHGCVRLPIKFAELLYGATKVGTPVVISASFSVPTPVVSSQLVGTAYSARSLGGAFATRQRAYQDGEPEARPVTSVLVSRDEKKVIVLENGVIVAEGDAVIDDPDRPFPSEVLVLTGADAEGLRWEAIGYGADETAETVPASDALDRIHGPENVAAAIKDRLAPGMILLITDQPITADTRSDTDFVVMTADDGQKQEP